MNEVKSRRALNVAATRDSLLESGLRLFVARGFFGVSTEEIVRAAGLTRGALYYHFDGKQGLFEAIFCEVQRQSCERIRSAVTTAGEDPRRQVLDGMDAFLDECTDVAYRRIVLQEGPAALGWTRWRELDEGYHTALLQDGLRALTDAGLIATQPMNLLVRAMFGVLMELSMGIADAADERAVRDDAAGLLRCFLGGLGLRP